jgi:hypothetical protein
MRERVVHYDVRVYELAEFFIDNNAVPLGLRPEMAEKREALVKTLASRIARIIDDFVFDEIEETASGAVVSPWKPSDPVWPPSETTPMTRPGAPGGKEEAGKRACASGARAGSALRPSRARGACSIRTIRTTCS